MRLVAHAVSRLTSLWAEAATRVLAVHHLATRATVSIKRILYCRRGTKIARFRATGDSALAPELLASLGRVQENESLKESAALA